MITSPKKFFLCRYLEKIVYLAKFFSFWSQCCCWFRNGWVSFSCYNLVWEWGFSCEVFGWNHSQQVIRAAAEECVRNKPFPPSIIKTEDLGNKEKPKPHVGARMIKVMMWKMSWTYVTVLFTLLLLFRPDGSSGWKCKDVRVGSFPADHLLQKSRELQSHQDTIQPPRKQGYKLAHTYTGKYEHLKPPYRCQTILSFATWLHCDVSLSDSATFSHFLSQLCH